MKKRPGLDLVQTFVKPCLAAFAAGALFFSGVASAAGNPEEGKKIFNGVCESCHGINGESEVPGVPVFARGERMDKTNARLKESIKNGVNNPDNPAGLAMPPFGGGPALSDKQLEDVLAYIRTLKK